MTVIILLNFLVAVISQSYEMVMSQQVISIYLHRCELNLECLRVLHYLGQLEPINMFTIAASDEVEGSDKNDEWLGFVSEIKKYIDRASRVNKINTQSSIKELR
jgi:hypothetical protein